MENKICVITGASSGIGKEMALELASMKTKLILIGKNKEKGENTLQEIRRLSGNQNVQMLYADFSDQDAIKHLASQIRDNADSIDILMNNAGCFYPHRTLSKNGLEMTFAVNHMGYFLFTKLLMDLVLKDRPGKIINTSSKAHYSANPDFSDLNLKKSYNGWKAYANSKLYNILFTYELAKRHQGSGLRVNAFHPGVIATDIVRNVFFPIPQLWKFFGRSVKDGAAGGIFLASSSETDTITGKFFDGKKEKKSSALSYDENIAKKLWEDSENYCS